MTIDLSHVYKQQLNIDCCQRRGHWKGPYLSQGLQDREWNGKPDMIPSLIV